MLCSIMFVVDCCDGTGLRAQQRDGTNAILDSIKRRLTALVTGNRGREKEAKSWLINTIASLRLQDAKLRRRKIAQFLPGGSAFDKAEHEEFGKQLLLGLFSDERKQVSRLIVREPSVLKEFFLQDDSHIRLWFGHFSINGLGAFKHGAASLARYALVYRDEAWQHLVWAGKHPQAPVAVAQKPHYFCELDVVATVHNLARDCPQFWESEQLREGLMDGQLLALAPAFWAQELFGWLTEFSARSDRLFELVCDYVESGADWRQLCGRLLSLLPPADLLSFASGLLDSADPPFDSSTPLEQGGSRARVPAGIKEGKGGRWPTLEQLVVASAVGCSLRQLGRLVQEAENGEELQEMQELAHELARCETPALHWHLRRQLAQQAKQHATRRGQAAEGAPSGRNRSEEEGRRQREKGGRRGRDGQAAMDTGGAAPPHQALSLEAAGSGERGNGGGGGEGGPRRQPQEMVGLQPFLLLHIWAGYLRLLQLAAGVRGSPAVGREAAVEEFRREVELAGVQCWPVGGGGGGGEIEGEDHTAALVGDEGGGGGWSDGGRKEEGRKHKKKSRRRSSSTDGGGGSSSEGGGMKTRRKHRRSRKKKKTKKKKNKERRGSKGKRAWSSGSDLGGSSDMDSLLLGSSLQGASDDVQAALFPEDPDSSVFPGNGGKEQQLLWRVRVGGGLESASLLTSAELIEVAMDHVTSCYAAWYCQQGF